MYRIHLDTNLGGDPDDLCALVMLLGREDVAITGITTTQDHDGQRAGYVRSVLRMLGREDIPVASGARSSMTTRQIASPFRGDPRYWPDPVPPALSGPTEAMDLLERSIRGGATIVCIGPVTNIAMFETFRADMMRKRRLVVMGGYLDAPESGFPQWGAEHDWNVQWDTRATEIVVNMDVALTLVPYPVAMHAPLSERDLRQIEGCGEIGSLLARQCRAYAEDREMAMIGRDHSRLPEDVRLIPYDAIAAVAGLGMVETTISTKRMMPFLENGIMWFEPSDDGREIDIVTAIDAEGFRSMFLGSVAAADRFSSAR